MGKLGEVRLTVLGRQGLSNLCAVIKIGGKLLEDIIKQIKTEGLKRIVVTDMEALTGEQIEALQAGDVVVKRDETGDHAYLVSYKGATGICLTYSDCENVETIAYEKVEGEWTYDSKDVTHIAS